ncbi:hypothetical protein QBC42DRAFT_313336 [Cladorrhinum samala]|uniref:BZIP domain-containing protein n=1 Tax=Cladorrhinum samala TaxID=585594 RepID=A0AAV9HDZ9_9PEZI|nr:hypothetical protein QBC42DRAFT_313336 [Cladorrhinum samala]
MTFYQLPSDQQEYEVDYTGVYPDEVNTQYSWDPTNHQQSGGIGDDYQNTPRQSGSGHHRSGSETEREYHRHSSGNDDDDDEGNMSSRSSKSGSPKSGKSSSSRHRKSDDWSEVTEPEERRRIQNRIAQRKFREKARELRDRQQREAQNQQFAGSSYAIPSADDLLSADSAQDDSLSGLPWGGINMRHVVARGHHHHAAAASESAGSEQRYPHHQQYYPQHQHHHNHHHNGLADHQPTAVMYSMNPYTSSTSAPGIYGHVQMGWSNDIGGDGASSVGDQVGSATGYFDSGYGRYYDGQ